MKSIKIAATNSRGITTYRSIRATSRVLSGSGSDHKRSTITRRCRSGGGIVNGVFVKFAK